MAFTESRFLLFDMRRLVLEKTRSHLVLVAGMKNTSSTSLVRNGKQFEGELRGLASTAGGYPHPTPILFR